MRAKTATQLLVGSAARMLPTPRRTSALLAVLLCGLLPHSASSAVLVQYDFSAGTTTASTATTAASASSIVTPPNLTLTALTAGAGWVGSDTTPNPFTGISTATAGGNPQPGLFVRSTGTTAKSGDIAMTSGEYYTFTVTPTGGSKLNLTSLTLDVARSAPPKTSPTFYVRSSADGFVGNLAVVAIPSAAVDGAYSSVNADLSGPKFQNLTGPIEFRISVVDGSTSTDLVNRFDNVVLNGAVAAGS